MFTGLIQATGYLHLRDAETVRITCATKPEAILPSLALGDSVAVDGVCLTVTEILEDGFIAAVSPETLRRSTLGRRDGALVNLEPSLRVGSKLGGHFVTGHVDGVGYLESSVQAANAWEMTFTTDDLRVSRYIVPKGSIAVNGISLTVAHCDAVGSWFQVAVIPLTYAETNLGVLQPGHPVNLEGDVLGKYVEKFLRLGTISSNDPVVPNNPVAELEERLVRSPDGGISLEFLADHGYL